MYLEGMSFFSQQGKLGTNSAVLTRTGRSFTIGESGGKKKKKQDSGSFVSADTLHELYRLSLL